VLHKEFWGLLFLAFVGWIFFTPDPQVRIARTCRPLLWTGNVAVSLTAFAMPSAQESVQKWSNKLDYGCRYTVWRLIYQDDYNRYVQGQSVEPEVPASNPSQGVPTGPATAPGSASVPMSDIPGRHQIPSDE